MAYVFSTEQIGKAKITDETETTFTLTGINAKTNDANIVMGGLSILLDVVGWKVSEAVRIVNQDIEEEETP